VDALGTTAGWDTVPLMRWERLFDDLEAQATDLELEERDALVAELRDGEWAQTSWTALLGGEVTLEVRGAGRVDGVVVRVNEVLTHLRGPRGDRVVANAAVTGVVATSRRADAPSAVSRALGWGPALRALREAAEDVRVTRVDGTDVDGMVDLVGQDFVGIRTPAGRSVLVPVTALAVVSGRA
jgi:hypothetical protein